MAETAQRTTPNQAPQQDKPNPFPALSQIALEGAGVAAQHFYGADDHFIGRAIDTGEHRLILTKAHDDGNSRNEAVGTGPDVASALQDSLVRMRSLETIHTKSLAHIEMTKESSVDFTSLEHYNPRVAPGAKAHPIPSYLESLVVDDPGDNQDRTYKNTIKQDGWQQEVRSTLEDYLAHDPAGQELVKTLKISSLSHLTPEQAVKLSTAFVQNVSKYTYADMKATTYTRADNSTAIDLLREGIANKDNPNWQGNGVCRNIASNVKAVFESLKATQGDLSMLNNTYAVFGGGDNGAGYADARTDHFTTSTSSTGHAWNTFVTIDAKGSAVATITDATWALGRDTTTALEHLDRTDIRAAAPMIQLYEKSERKPEAFGWLSHYLEGLVRRSGTNPRLTQSQRDNLREYATTEYLKAASQLSEIPEGHTLPGDIMTAAYRMRDKLEQKEIATLFALDKAGGSLERERLKRVIAGYDKDRKVPLPGWKSAENLVFTDNELQDLAYEAIGEARITQLAETSGLFRSRLRQRQPDSLPPFDPLNREADARELNDIAFESGIRERDPKTIIASMKRNLKRLSGDTAIYDAILAGRSDADVALHYKAITTALRQRPKN